MASGQSQSQSWSLAGIDPKVREAAREAAARQGMTLAEYLNAALAARQPSAAAPSAAATAQVAPRPRARFSYGGDANAGEEDWRAATGLKSTDANLSQRLESIERRTQLAVAGLDRAVATIDRSLVGLASRIEDAEAMSAVAANRIAEALEHFRTAGDTLGGDVEETRARLENQAAVAEEIARRAEATANYLANTMDNRDAQVAQTLAHARAIAEEAAEHAAQASADAVKELRRLQQEMSERLSETEESTRRAVVSAIESVRAEATGDMIGASEGLIEQVARLEADVAARLGGFDQLKTDQAALISRIERAEANAREATAGLRQAAGAAIADLRNAQLTLAARVKQVEDVGGAGVDVTDLRHAQQDIAERLAALEAKTDASPVTDALAAFEARIAQIESDGAQNDQIAQVDGAVKTLDASLQRLAARIAETESTANTAIRTLEETVSSIGARVEQVDAAQETEALRAMLEQRLDSMAQSVSQMVGDARTELAGQLHAALEGVASKGLEDALADVNARLANAERRQAQTIEAISLEIKRMSETVDKRLRTVEARNDDAAAVAVREELSRMASTLEQRFDEIERREAAAFDRMGLEVGRLSERLEERVGAVEVRSAQAIEHVGEQVARMAERFSQRHETLARELGERMVDSEERTGQRVSDAISSMMQRLAEVEASSAEAIAPVQKAVSSVASKLDQYETQIDPAPSSSERPAPPLSFEDLEQYVDLLDDEPPPVATATPDEAASAVFDSAPAPTQEVATPTIAQDDDIYFSEIDDDLLIEDAPTETPIASTDDALPPPPPATSADDDLLAEDPIASQVKSGVEPDNNDAFWLPPPNENADIDAFKANDAPVPAAPVDAPAGKNAYLANARRAAQAQALPKARPETIAAPKLSLRGPSRIVVWGAASLVTLLLIGGARYWVQQNAQTQDAAPSEPAVETPVVDPATDLPIDETLTIAPPVDGETPTIAGPLPPRNVSLEQAAQSGDLVAQYELALQRLSAGRSQDAITLLRGAADRGFAMAQYRLAKLYERGEGVQADLGAARQWTERAAASGNRRAMHDLGVYFARGEGAPLDEAAAFRWFRQAAELGVADSQYNLGVLYQQGRGVNASPSEALFWFLVAARQGDQDASARALALEAQLTQAQVGQARARAEAFRPRAANAVANGDFGPRPWAPPRPAT
jgi:localization factor PodJL